MLAAQRYETDEAQETCTCQTDRAGFRNRKYHERTVPVQLELAALRYLTCPYSHLGAAQAVVLLLCGVGMVVQWYFALPGAITWFLMAVTALAIGCLLCFLRYTALLASYTYVKKVATGKKSICDVRILGGRQLLPDAEVKRTKLGIDIQALFEGAAYNPDLIWSRDAPQWVKQRVLVFFILTLVLGTSALTGASIATQVLLTKKAAASIIRTSDAPGLSGGRR